MNHLVILKSLRGPIQRVLIMSVAVVIAAGSAYAQSGLVRPTAVSFSDHVTGASVTVFESSDNEDLLLDTDQSKLLRLRYYVAPIFVFLAPTVPTPTRVQDQSVYRLEVWSRHPGMLEQARQAVNRQLDGKIQFPSTAPFVNHLTHQLVAFSLPAFPNVRVNQLGTDLTTDVPVADRYRVDFTVSNEDKAAFEEMLQNGGLSVQALLHYNGVRASRRKLQWNLQHIVRTRAYKNLDQAGANFVSAQQVQDVLSEAALLATGIDIRDASFSGTIDPFMEETFESLVRLAQEVAVEDRESANRLDEQLRQGTGLSSQDFKPIVLMWNIVEKLKTTNNFREANAAMKTHYRSNKRTFEGSAGAGFGPFSASVGYSKTNEDIDSGFFKDENEYQQFKREHIEGTGPDARVVFRGLRLLDRSSFESNKNVLVRFVTVQLSDEARTFATPTAVVTGVEADDLAQKLSDTGRDLRDLYVRTIPIGTIIPFYGSLQEAEAQTALGWWICDGRTVQEPRSSAFHARDTPDLRNRFLMGSADLVAGAVGGADKSGVGPFEVASYTTGRWGSQASDNRDLRTLIWSAGPWGAGSPIESKGTLSSFDISTIPPYYSVLYLIKVW